MPKHYDAENKKKNRKNSEDMDNLTSDFNKLLDKYATTNKNK